MCISNMLMGENFYIRYTCEVFNVAGKERHVMSLANSSYKDSSFRGVSISTSFSAPSRLRKPSASLVKTIASPVTSIFIFSPSVSPSLLRIVLGKIIESFLFAFTVIIGRLLVNKNRGMTRISQAWMRQRCLDSGEQRAEVRIKKQEARLLRIFEEPHIFPPLEKGGEGGFEAEIF